MEVGDQRPGVSVGRTSGAWIDCWLHLLCLLLPQFSAQIPITLLQPRCSSREEAVTACVKAQQDCFLRVGDTGGIQPWEMLCTWSTHANCILLALFLRQLSSLTFHVFAKVSVQPNTFYPHNLFCMLQAIEFENSIYSVQSYLERWFNQ